MFYEEDKSLRSTPCRNSSNFFFKATISVISGQTFLLSTEKDVLLFFPSRFPQDVDSENDSGHQSIYNYVAELDLSCQQNEYHYWFTENYGYSSVHFYKNVKINLMAGLWVFQQLNLNKGSARCDYPVSRDHLWTHFLASVTKYIHPGFQPSRQNRFINVIWFSTARIHDLDWIKTISYNVFDGDIHRVSYTEVHVHSHIYQLNFTINNTSGWRIHYFKISQVSSDWSSAKILVFILITQIGNVRRWWDLAFFYFSLTFIFLYLSWHISSFNFL